ncbi:ATP-dependent DNA helicase RecG [Brevundimonas halotolerans]|uniref:ATP-dependent DNA helicase RecG n=1 Tax=Brevundimonas halotolerans TaxID=69670 RepID=A0A7W9E7F5_9CAUL|nr:ATP-dependent DNA helicase RecG [Brevundimonas halotolerans]MBB5659650.1 ATP-dependent DNA helicase RecG [Brevundimonas halotolerans]
MRPEILFPLFVAVESLKGVGPRMAPAVHRLAGPLVRDLMFLAPTGLIRRREMTVQTAVAGEVGIFDLIIGGLTKPGRPGLPFKLRANDETGFLTLVWFGGSEAWIRKQCPDGERRIVSGKVETFNDLVQIAHPDYVVSAEKRDEIVPVEPVYPATQGITSRQVRKLVMTAMESLPDLAEWQDAAWLAKQAWPSWPDAMKALHAPESEIDLDPQAPARARLAFDELLAHQLALARRRRNRQAVRAPRLAPGAAAERLLAALPFTLTGAQQRAVADIRRDLASGEQMARLLQGDVGSGKTAVAALVLADAIDSGFQAALMAPTDILARQHHERLAPLFAEVGVACALLTGRDPASVRRPVLEGLAGGRLPLVIGTHALFQDSVQFHRLGLAVIDEQHRFGVRERQRLLDKGGADGAVHLLTMSATPIPRTLELTQYGELDVSRLDEKPPGRRPIKTAVLPLDRLGEVAVRLKAAIEGGAQAYWICPLIEESEHIDLAAAEDRARDLGKLMGRPVGLVHGRMPGPERETVMQSFLDGHLPLLVATTVVEVGVDVPNATLMVIEHAERFGLAQLHQLRGRIGRSDKPSACTLLYGQSETGLGKTAVERLDILRRTEDGFEIAEADFRIRGGGDPLGLKQSGFPAYRFADPMAHAGLIRAAADDAQLILGRDPGLTSNRGRAVQMLEALFDWRSGRPSGD